MNLIKLLAVMLLVLILMSCAKKKEPVVTDPVAVSESTTISTDQQYATANQGATALTAEQKERKRLESRAKEIEDMINKIMSEDVYFDYDKTELTERARELLTQVGDILIQEEKFIVVVEGHTDERGTESYNLSLGGKRALAVQKYLLSYGVATDRIQTLSFGEEKPKVEGAGEEVYEKNRRANFKVNIK